MSSNIILPELVMRELEIDCLKVIRLDNQKYGVIWQKGQSAPGRIRTCEPLRERISHLGADQSVDLESLAEHAGCVFFHL